jgi:hypothetical protein
MKKSLKSFRSEYKFVVSIVEEDVVVNIDTIIEHAIVDESNPVTIKTLTLLLSLNKK